MQAIEYLLCRNGFFATYSWVTTMPGMPRLTLRDNTERLETDERTHRDRSKQAAAGAGAIDSGKMGKGAIPPKWDGTAAERMVENL